MILAGRAAQSSVREGRRLRHGGLRSLLVGQGLQQRAHLSDRVDYCVSEEVLFICLRMSRCCVSWKYIKVCLGKWIMGSVKFEGTPETSEMIPEEASSEHVHCDGHF